MRNLTQWLVIGPIIAVIYMVIGYHMAMLSREVRKNWDKLTLNGISIQALMVFLYPLVAADRLSNKEPFWHLGNYKYSQPSYVIKHLFFWPLRIVGNIILILVLFVIVPMVAFLSSLLCRMIGGTIEAVSKKIKSETV